MLAARRCTLEQTAPTHPAAMIPEACGHRTNEVDPIKKGFLKQRSRDVQRGTGSSEAVNCLLERNALRSHEGRERGDSHDAMPGKVVRGIMACSCSRSRA